MEVFHPPTHIYGKLLERLHIAENVNIIKKERPMISWDREEIVM